MLTKLKGILIALAFAAAIQPALAQTDVLAVVDTPNIPSADPAAAGKLNALLAHNQSFRASFVQRLYKPKEEKAQEYQGTLALKRPNRFRWQVTSPDKQLLVADGKDLWFYDEDLQQVTVTPIDEAIGTTPAALLSSSTIDVEKNFYVLQTIDTPKEQQFQLNPKRSDQLITKILVTFENGTLTDMIVTDSTGQRSEIRFSKVETNPVLPSSMFVYKVPAGVDVIGKQKGK